MKHASRWIAPVWLLTVVIAAGLGWWARDRFHKPKAPESDQGAGQGAAPKKESWEFQRVVTIKADADGYSAAEVETSVAAPIELAIKDLPGVRRVRSISRNDRCGVSADLDERANVIEARQRIRKRLELVGDRLPPTVRTTIAPPGTTRSTFLLIGLLPAKGPKTAEKRRATAMQLRTLADQMVRPRLLKTAGVADALVSGGIRKRCEVIVDPGKLSAHNLTLQEVCQAIERSMLDAGAVGAIGERNPPRIRQHEPVAALTDVAGIVVATTREGKVVLVEHVARVRYGGADESGNGAVRRNQGENVSGGAGVVLTVMQYPEAKDRAVELALAELRKQLPAEARLEHRAFTPDDLSVIVLFPAGIVPEQQAAIATQIEDELLTVPEVRSVWRRGGLDPMNESVELCLALEKNAGRARAVILADVRKHTGRILGAQVVLCPPAAQRIDGVSAHAAIAVKVFGPDLSELNRIARQIKVQVSEVRGAVDVFAEPVGTRAQPSIEIDHEKTRLFGIALRDVAAQLEAYLDGHKVAELEVKNDRLDLVVQCENRLRNDHGELRKLQIRAGDGKMVQLGAVAHIVLKSAPVAIQREDVERQIVVSCNVQGRHSEDVAKEIRSALSGFKLPNGYRIVHDASR